jgi:hypothetical protein
MVSPFSLIVRCIRAIQKPEAASEHGWWNRRVIDDVSVGQELQGTLYGIILNMIQI